MSNLARYNGTAFVVTNGSPVVAPLASVAVRREDTGALASLFSDRDGLVGLSNPLTADSEGRFSFHAAGLEDGYRVTATEAASPGQSLTLRYVPVGTFAELDNPFTTKGDLLVATAAAIPTRKAVGSDGYVVVPSSAASDGLAWMPPGLGFNLVGGYLDWATVGSPTSTLTVSIKTWAGNSPSDSEPVFIAFRSATPGTGSLTYRKITAATSLVLDDTALLGVPSSNTAFKIWCVAFDDAGTIRLALINCLSGSSIYPLGAFPIASATQEGVAADAAHVFYSSGAAVAAKAYAVLGYASWETGLVNVGNWNANPTRIQPFGPGVPLPGALVQRQVTTSSAGANLGANLVPIDNTTPQNGEMNLALSQAITPMMASNLLRAFTRLNVTHNAGARIIVGIFRDAAAGVLKISAEEMGTVNLPQAIDCLYEVVAGQVTSTTFKAYAAGTVAGNTFLNSDAGAAVYNGTLDSRIEVEEIQT